MKAYSAELVGKNSSHRYMKVHVFVTMVSKSALKSPNLLPSFTKTAISLNDGITRRDRVPSHLSPRPVLAGDASQKSVEYGVIVNENVLQRDPKSEVRNGKSLAVKLRGFWWEQRESNPRPSACKADALNQLSYAPETGLQIYGHFLNLQILFHFFQTFLQNSRINCYICSPE